MADSGLGCARPCRTARAGFECDDSLRETCARVDSNHHGENSPQGPQPCASTNSATSAEWASIALGSSPASAPEARLGRASVRARSSGRAVESAPDAAAVCRALHPSTAGATVRTRVRFRQHFPRTARGSGMDLTKRQQEIFDFIRKYSAKYGYPPTVRDIGKAVGLASSSTVHAHLANLERIGLLRRDPTKPRAIELLDRAAAGVRGFVNLGLPLVGQVAAGQPVVAEENIEEYIQTPEFAGGADGEFLLRVRGGSMIEAGILDADLVVVRPQDTATDGEIVVALVGDEATVKRFFQEEDHVRLQPENATMEPIRSKEVRVLGRVVGLMRSIS